MTLKGLAQSLVTHSSKRRRLLVAGTDAFSATPSRVTPLRLAPVESWLGALGFAEDVRDGSLEVMHVAAGLGHSLIAYRTAKGVERILSLGRNDCGQLGIGYSSTETTRGHVEGFSGSRILQLAAGNASSYMLVEQGDSRKKLYAFGSRMRGQLGLPTEIEAKPAARNLQMSCHATEVPIPDDHDVVSVSSGFEHVLALCKDENGRSKIFSSGANPDGQLGVGTQNDVDVFTPVDGVEDVAAVCTEADSSACISTDGQLCTWGNSEYAQCLHGHVKDAICRPRRVELHRPIRDIAFGGSFALLLDRDGSVYTAGFGALGLGEHTLRSLNPTRLPSLDDSTNIRAAYNYAAAIKDGQIYIWGLAQGKTGRLGFGPDLERLYEPRHLPLPAGLQDARVVDAQLGGQNLWLIVEQDA